MNRLLIIFTFFLLSIGLNAQKIIYKPVVIDQCTDSLVKTPFWYITDFKYKGYIPNSLSNGVCLPKPGKYYLNGLLEIGETPELDIKKYEIL